MHARVRPSLHPQVEALPDGLIGAIPDGQRHTQPRPSGPYAYAASMLGADLGSALRHGARWTGSLVTHRRARAGLSGGRRGGCAGHRRLAAQTHAAAARWTSRHRGPGLGLRSPVAVHAEQGSRDRAAHLRPLRRRPCLAPHGPMTIGFLYRVGSQICAEKKIDKTYLDFCMGGCPETAFSSSVRFWAGCRINRHLIRARAPLSISRRSMGSSRAMRGMLPTARASSG